MGRGAGRWEGGGEVGEEVRGQTTAKEEHYILYYKFNCYSHPYMYTKTTHTHALTPLYTHAHTHTPTHSWLDSAKSQEEVGL